tara:strand:- start:74 stop:787 length:714 start_codon:yes stop_codon:yes gene_type:complete
MCNYKNLFSIFFLFTLNISAQNINSDSTKISNTISNELHRIKVFNDSVFLNFENFKSSTARKLKKYQYLFNKLDDATKSNFSLNQTNYDSLFKISDELFLEIDKNKSQIADQSLIQNKNIESFDKLVNSITKKGNISILFFAIILIGLVFFYWYFNKKNGVLNTNIDFKIKEVFSSQKSLNDSISSISEVINTINFENDLSSKKLKVLSENIKNLKSVNDLSSKKIEDLLVRIKALE